MAWQMGRYSLHYPLFDRERLFAGPAAINDQCFIRKEHKCGKMYGASKSCFIACPSDDDLEPILELMAEKLTKLGVEPIIAIKERAYGQDIFCTKICGKIIEARFCIVILDDSLKNGTPLPNPNVYYEYGLMTALRKHIIPLQKEHMKLAFNIQSHDTIKYNPKNIGSELERGIRDAIKISDTKEPEKEGRFLAERSVLRKMEIAGFDAKDDKWFLSDVIEDTGFKGYGHEEKGFYAYLGKIDASKDLQAYLDDLPIVVYRTEKAITGMKSESKKLQKKQQLIDKQAKNLSAIEIRRLTDWGHPPKERIAEIDERIRLMATLYIGFIMTSDLKISDFQEAANGIIGKHSRYRIVCSKAGRIQFGSVTVDFSETQR